MNEFFVLLGIDWPAWPLNVVPIGFLVCVLDIVCPSISSFLLLFPPLYAVSNTGYNSFVCFYNEVTDYVAYRWT